MFNSKRLSIYALTIFLYLGKFPIDASPETQKQELGIKTGGNSMPFRPGERDTIRPYFASNLSDINRVDASGNTVLMVAAIYDNVKVVRTFLDNNADRNIKNINRKTVKDIADRERERPNEFLKANLRIVPRSKCNNTVLEFNKTPNLLPAFRSSWDNSQYCAFILNGVKDSCQGDSRGPLQIYPYGVPIAQVVGIVSFGVSCGSALYKRRFSLGLDRINRFAKWL